MIYRSGGGLSFGLGVVVEMVVVFLGFLSFEEDNNGGERERERELPPLCAAPKPSIYRVF